MRDRFQKIAEKHDLGMLKAAPVEIPGGFLHRMYRMDTEKGSFAVKLLNPTIMAREDAHRNFDTAEKYESLLQQKGLPIVPALDFGGIKRQRDDAGEYYIFDWCSGTKTDWRAITPEQCGKVGKVLGAIHTCLPAQKGERTGKMAVDWKNYSGYPGIGENLGLLERAQESYNRAIGELDEIICLSNGDMDPKNVLWLGGEPRIIDLECLCLENPQFDVFQLAIQWSGIVTGNFDPVCFHAFIDAYERASGTVMPDPVKLYGIGFTWLDWLEYNIKRALGIGCADESERTLGIEQAKLALDIILYYDSIADVFRNL